MARKRKGRRHRSGNRTGDDARRLRASESAPGKVGRNDPCPCGSGKKYKRCCLPKDQARVRQEAAERAGEPPAGGADPEVNRARLEALIEGLSGGGRDRGARGGAASEAASALSSLPAESKEALKDLVVGLLAKKEDVDDLEERARAAVRKLSRWARAAFEAGALLEDGRRVLDTEEGTPPLVELGARLFRGAEGAAQYIFWYVLLGDELWPASFRAWREEVLAEVLTPEERGLLPGGRAGDRLGVWKLYQDPKSLMTVMEDWAPRGEERGAGDGARASLAMPVRSPGGSTRRVEHIPLSVPFIELTADRWLRPDDEVLLSEAFVGWRGVREGFPVFLSLVPLTDAELPEVVSWLEREGVGPDSPSAVRERAILEAAVEVLLAAATEPPAAP